LYPKVNQNIVMEIKGRDKGFRSIIADIGEQEMFIGVPLDRENIGLITAESELNIFFLTEDNQYKFSTKVIGKTADKIPLYRVVKPLEQEIKKIQRRDNFRVKTTLTVNLKDTELVTIDLSVGGLLVSSLLDFDVRPGEVVSGAVYVPNRMIQAPEAIPFQGIVQRIVEMKEQDKKRFAIKFTEVEKSNQIRITQYCFERQRQLRMKERER